uniref:Uncharacterized protein n=1 Tax=Candidatus Kentrum sp. TUN TaxID=2126343 RepID=A0A451AN07_9GAMM|nr:MAG: hypothetical protein BECKTUN1418F_GA0071002_11603 [Candidatus Kentron sp. TUN]VFK67441.1 MAG: hypothetical protein BECKTUN1418E_GA0071001_11473 [Candidatus Kentron sp. TUN]
MKYKIAVEIDGAVYEGSYIFYDNMVTVFFGEKDETKQMNGAANSIQGLAMLTLKRLVEKSIGEPKKAHEKN